MPENYKAGGFYAGPVLSIETGMHLATINRFDIDASWKVLVTGSDDKTVRIWCAESGELSRVVRIPSGPGTLGQVNAVSITPDGNTIAVGGQLGSQRDVIDERIFIIDAKNGEIQHQLGDLDDCVLHLAFSLDGQRLAATMRGKGGMRLFERRGYWKEIAGDTTYQSDAYCIAFAKDGRFASSSWDGSVRLYNPGGKLLSSAPLGGRPTALSFRPDGERIAVTFWEEPRVLILRTGDLEILGTAEYYSGAFASAIDWSSSGEDLHIGIFDMLVVQAGIGVCSSSDFSMVSADATTPITHLRMSPKNERMFTTGDPSIARDNSDGSVRWCMRERAINSRREKFTLGISFDGNVVDFGYGDGSRACFDVSKLSFVEFGDSVTSVPYPGAPDGRSLPLQQYEHPECLADHPDGRRAVVGTSWHLIAIEEEPIVRWINRMPGPTWAINVSGDGRLVVASCADGTIRSYRMEDGAELLSLFPLVDKENWIVWTPEGVYASSPNARKILRWHVNRGTASPADAVPVSDIPETYRPEVIPHVLPQLGTAMAIAFAELTKIRTSVQRATGSDLPPGARLFVLAIGVSDYGTIADLDLRYAHQDALDLAAALKSSQTSLYADVSTVVLTNESATKERILSELASIRDAMSGGVGDVAVIFFAGHGYLDDDEKFYLCPYAVNNSSAAALEASALAATDFHDKVARLAKYGRAVLFLDACRSGGATNPLDRSLHAMFAAPNLAVFTSSAASEDSIECVLGAMVLSQRRCSRR